MHCGQIAVPRRPVRPVNGPRAPREDIDNPDAMALLRNVKRLPYSPDSTISTPVRLGYYSVIVNNSDGDYKVCQDTSALRVLNLPTDDNPQPISLLEGFVEGQAWKRAGPGDHILNWLRANGKKVTNQWGNDNEIGSDFVCDSHQLDKIMKTNYARSRGWSMIAIKIDGVIYIFPDTSLPGENGRSGETANTKVPNYKHMYRECKYEQTVTRRQDGDRGFLSSNGYRDSFYLVCEATVGFHRVLYSYRADCIVDKEQLTQPLEKMKFACLRTAPARCGDELTKFLCLSWWIKGALNSSSDVVVGEETASHLTGTFKQFRICDLASPFQFWSPLVCTKFLDSVLTFIQTKVTMDLQPYRFYYDNREAIFCEMLDQPVNSFIPSWYTDSVQNN